MSSNILFITGTDTGVGKTTISCAITRVLVSEGLKVHVIKPIETGCVEGESGKLIPRDGELLWQASGRLQSLEDIVPYRFKTPVAPQVAAQIEGAEFDISEIIEDITFAANDCDLLIVEGAGGLLVPLVGNYTFANLAKDLGMQLVVVIGSKLGALNHASLTFEVMKSRGLNALGYVLNDLFAEQQTALGYDVALHTNEEVLRRIAQSYGLIQLAAVPFSSSENFEMESKIFSDFARLVREKFGLK